jgi:hypothetical protein
MHLILRMGVLAHRSAFRYALTAASNARGTFSSSAFDATSRLRSLCIVPSRRSRSSSRDVAEVELDEAEPALDPGEMVGECALGDCVCHASSSGCVA